MQEAFKLVDEAEFNAASDMFDKAIEMGCSYLPLALNYSGTFAFIRGDPETAIKEFDKSLALDEKQPQVWAKRASVHMEKGTPPRVPFPPFLDEKIPRCMSLGTT